MSSAYRSLHINTSRERMEYSDFPMPKSFPDFPHHTHIAKYFNDYVDHFGFRDRIRFETGVAHVARAATTACWTVELEDGETRLYDAVMVANGHHWDARWPEPASPASSRGQMHAHDYKDAERVPRQARGRAGDGQQRDGHRRRSRYAPTDDLPRRATRRLGHPQVRSGQAARPARAAAVLPV